MRADGARARRDAYRALVYDDPDFAAFFHAVTPMDGDLAAAARLAPGRRGARREGIEDLRAIPWVFSWTQARIVLPAGTGSAPRSQRARGRTALELLQRDGARLAASSPRLLSNAEMACAKADLHIGRRYAELCDDDEARDAHLGPRSRTSSSARVAQLAAVTRRRRACSTASRSLQRLDRPPQPVRRPALVHPDRAAAPRPRRATATRSWHARACAVNGIASGLRNTG